MAKRKPKTKRKPPRPKGGKKAAARDEPVSLHPLKFTEAVAALMGKPTKKVADG